MQTKDSVALKVHLDSDGLVWFADGMRVVMCSGLRVPEFVDSIRGRKHLCLRTIGLPGNAPLITSLYPLTRDGAEFELASPLICKTAAERREPHEALWRMRSVSLPASLGGWHRVTSMDYISYSLVWEVAKRWDGNISEHAQMILQEHPAMPYLSFITTLSPRFTAVVLSLIADPRWFIDIKHPDRVSKLQAYMGLLPKTMKRVTNGDTRSSAAFRCHAVLRAWTRVQPEGADRERPGAFLWRIVDSHEQPERGLLAASQKFIIFLRHCWLQALTASTRYSGAEPLFAPNMLFRTTGEIQSFQNHVRRAKSGLTE